MTTMPLQRGRQMFCMWKCGVTMLNIVFRFVKGEFLQEAIGSRYFARGRRRNGRLRKRSRVGSSRLKYTHIPFMRSTICCKFPPKAERSIGENRAQTISRLSNRADIASGASSSSAAEVAARIADGEKSAKTSRSQAKRSVLSTPSSAWKEHYVAEWCIGQKLRREKRLQTRL